MASVCLGVGGECLRIECPSSDVIREISTIWSPAVLRNEGEPDRRIRVDEAERIWVDGAPAPETEERRGLTARLHWFLVADYLRMRANLVHLHMGGIVWGGSLVCLVGASGAGKSTMTLQAVRAGAGYMSDDCLLLAQGLVFSMGRAVHFSPLKWPAEVPSYLDGFDLTSFRYHKDTQTRVVPLWVGDYEAIQSRPVRTSSVVVVQIARGESDAIEELDSVERLRTIHEAVITSGREYEGELGFGPTYRLTWKHPQAAFALLRSRLEHQA